MVAMREQMEALKKEVAQLRKNAPPAPNFAMGVTEAAPADCQICLRGDPKKRGPRWKRGFLAVIRGDKIRPAIEDEARADAASSPTGWSVPRIPLAARVMVNRVWHHLFGTGLVRTVDNFGKMGEAPVQRRTSSTTSPSRFMEEGWSVKKPSSAP